MAKDNELPKINLQGALGGESIDFKNGISGAVYKSQAMDGRQKASQITVLPGLYNLTNNLPDLPLAIDQDINGVRYMAGNLGNVYRISVTNVVSKIFNSESNGGAGLVYNAQNDNLYISSQQSVSLFGQCTNTNTPPSPKVTNFGASASVAPGVIYIFDTASLSYDGGIDNNTNLTTQRNNLNQLTVTGVTPANYASLVTNTLTNTYTLPKAISETVGQFCGFVPDIEPFQSVAVYCTSVGTGNWTLTMHDSLNNNLGAITIPHASIVKGWNLFVFNSPGIRAFVNAIASNTLSTGYHFHLTSSVASDTAAVATIAPGDLTGCNFVLFAYRLVQSRNGWHPMCIFNQYLVIGNGNYVSTYNFGNDSNPNNSQWVRHQLFLDVGYEVTGVTNSGQYCVITAERKSTVAGRNYQGGFIYLWDGLQASFNMKVPVPMGSPYSPECNNNVIYFYCAGSLFAYVPGSLTVVKVRYIGYQNTDYLGTYDHTVVNPNMMTTRYNLLLLGYPSITTNTSVNYGIYSWGAVELIYPNSFSYSYVLASGQQNYTSQNNLQIGMIQNFVDAMYVSSQYTDTNGTHNCLDVLDNTSSVAPNFGISCLIWDGGARYKMKKGLRVKVSFVALPAGVTITPWYSIDRASQVSQDVSGTPFTVGQGATNVLINIPNARSHELQWGFNGTAAPGTTTTPIITGITAEVDALGDESDLRVDG